MIKVQTLTTWITVLVGMTVALMFSVSYVKANPSFFIRSSNTSTTFPIATTTQAYINTGGVSTTTLALDLGVAGAQAADSATLLIQLTSTTSSPTLNVDIQYSQDNVDWYASPIGMDYQNLATSTVNLGVVETLQFLYASSTISRGNALPAPATSTQTSTRIVNIKTPTRYVRAVFYTTGTVAAGLWAEFIAKRQSN